MDPICNACHVRHSPLWRCSDPRIVVVNASNAVVNAQPVVVNAPKEATPKKRTQDRHKDKDARREYLRLKMREVRAKKKGAVGLD